MFEGLIFIFFQNVFQNQNLEISVETMKAIFLLPVYIFAMLWVHG